MSQDKTKNIIEAALMVSNQPLSVTKILSLFEAEHTMEVERDEIRAALEELQNDYEGRGIELVEVASGFRIQARNDYADWVNHLFDERPPRYSRALLETLAIIAYRQPITRGEIEEIRGVSVSSTIVKTLQEREWVKIVGHRDVPGKPALLATTKSFLDYFNLKKLSELPALEDIKDFDSINPDLFEELEGNTNAEAGESSDEETSDNAETSEADNQDIESISEENDEQVIEAEVEEELEEENANVVPFVN
jgi:segregation and condensation protein B